MRRSLSRARLLWPLAGVSVAVVLSLGPAASWAANSCPPDDSVQNRLEAEREASQNAVARERAAIADLRVVTMKVIREKYSRHEIDMVEYNRLTDQRGHALDCIEADNALKDRRTHYTKQEKLIEAGCQKPPIKKHYVSLIREGEKRKAEDCAKADLEYLAQTVRQLKEIQADKLAKEEKPTPAVKTVDTSQTNDEFCARIRSVTAEAPTFFAKITREKAEKWFIEPGTLGSKGVKISEITPIDQYVTPVSLSQEFLSAPARCVIQIGTAEELWVRIVPTYDCTWEYQKTSLRELEQRTDRLLNLVRGCYGKTSENGNYYRHEFVADDAVQVTGDLHNGEGKPSYITLKISKYTPKENEACLRYSFQHKAADKELCLKQFRP